jgi:putative endonuclease
MIQEYFFVYLLASHSGTLYIGMTNNILRRVAEHKAKLIPGFTSKYGCTRLVYYEWFNSPGEAIDREKQLKGWRRSKKEALIRTKNPKWFDLSMKWRLPDVRGLYDSNGDGRNFDLGLSQNMMRALYG